MQTPPAPPSLPNKPGIYDISNNDYHASEGISRSGIMQLAKSPLHYYKRYLDPNRVREKQSAALIFGSAFHTKILEPHKFNAEYCARPEGLDLRYSKDKAIFADFEAINYGKTVLKHDEMVMLNAMFESVMAHNTARAIIEGAQYERSIYYTDPATGELCKAKPDILHGHYIADLKSTADASYYNFARDAHDYGYFLQAAMMFDAVQQVLNATMQEFIMIAVEKEPPYAVATYPLSLEDIEFGKAKYRNELLKLAECKANNHWPSFESRVISLPSWAKVF